MMALIQKSKPSAAAAQAAAAQAAQWQQAMEGIKKQMDAANAAAARSVPKKAKAKIVRRQTPVSSPIQVDQRSPPEQPQPSAPPTPRVRRQRLFFPYVLKSMQPFPVSAGPLRGRRRAGGFRRVSSDMGLKA